MEWIYLIAVSLLEMLGVTMMNQFHKDKRLKWIFLLIIGFAASFILLSLAMNTLPMGTAYAI